LDFYDVLITISRSLAAAVNRGVALSHVHGLEAALAELRTLGADPRLETYQPYWAALAEMLSQAGDSQGAGRAYDRAIALQPDPAARGFLVRMRARRGD
jgi:RNA polymerase sigma-70 factor (ECF subfamily)